MVVYVTKRLAELAGVLIAVAFIVFASTRMMPGDPARLIAGPTASDQAVQSIRTALGLDEPVLTQFFSWLGGVVQGDFGTSFYYGTAALPEVISRFPATLQLAGASILVSGVLGVAMGILAAVYRGTVIDRTVIILSLIGICVPAFWSGLMLIWYFSVVLQWLPSTGMGTWQHFILPSFTLGLFGLGLIARITRAAMLETQNEDFIRTARAKGLTELRVIFGHTLKNALIPVVTVAGLQFGGYLGRAVVTETVFSWPGLGRLIIQSVQNRDFTIIQAAVLLMATTFVLVNLLVDVAYAVLDPRIRYG